jgi:acyl carrier protein
MQPTSSSLTLNEQTTETTPTQALEEWLVNQLATQLSLDVASISVTEPLTRYGLDSIDAVTMVGDLEDWLDLELPSTLFWDYPTIEKSAHYLAENFDITQALDTNNVTEENAESVVTTEEKGKGWGDLWGRLKGA